ncbi:hypothetical protein AWM70_17165 [Paenibacillus yonginensis]|uniref:Uncharacterized protein n=1 Tax=Paenibacillus yonginensis TaxID=1462996 RepID=A0A1B1N3V9_9BACL|nr:DUF6470 family protein [Paenibacillus yonginensis]ANS76099.1 hypothetical protein AWM70_17165 [Paenibacillus yonginensis]
MGIDVSLSPNWGQYRPADITIRIKQAELTTDWTNVYNDMDLKRPEKLRKDLSGKTNAEFTQSVAEKAQEGDRIGNLARNEKNAFGHVAFERFTRFGQKETNIALVPSQGVYIDFRSYPPEIHVEARGVLPK